MKNSLIKSITALTILFLILVNGNVVGASYEWVSLNEGLPTCKVLDIDADSSNAGALYVVVNSGSIFKTNNRGLEWYQSSKGLEGNEVSCVTVNVKNHKIIYSGGFGVFKSEDSGESWSQLNFTSTSKVLSIKIDPSHDNKIYAITEDEGIFKSEDYGENWFPINDGFITENSFFLPHVSDIIFDSSNSNIIYACTSDGMFKTENGGTIWSKISSGLLQKVTSTRTDPITGKKIIVEYDALPFVYSGIINKSNPNNLVIATGFGIFTSKDAGGSWTKLNGFEGINVKKLIVFSKTGAVIAITDKGLYESLDNCVSWKEIQNTPKNTEIIDATITENDTSELWIATDKGVYVSTLGSEDFILRKNGLVYFNLQNLYFSSVNNIVFATASGDGLYKYSNKDNAWVSLKSGLENVSVICISEDPKDSNKLFVGTNEGIYVSLNGGASFEEESKKLEGNTIFSIICLDSNTLIAGTNNGIFRSEDGGNTWYPSNSGISDDNLFSCISFAFDPNEPSLIYLGTAEKGIYKSEDSGKKWVSLNSNLDAPYPPINVIKIDSRNSSTIYIGTEGNGLLQSKNGGLSWAKIEGLDSPWVKDFEISPTDSSILYVLLYPSKILRTTNGGKSWEDITGTLSIKEIVSIEFSGESLLCGTKTGIYKLEMSYLINVSASSGGNITPSGAIKVQKGETKSFQIIPNAGYKIKEIKVDGVTKGATTSYTFTNITSDHTITVTFEKEITQTVIILQIGNTTFTVNGSTRTLDSPPVIKNNRTLLPIRAVVEALGGTVDWNATERKVTISLGSDMLELWIGKPTAKVNGIDTPIDSANPKVVPEIINNRTMLPLRFITESLGCSVQWDGTTKTITITYGG